MELAGTYNARGEVMDFEAKSDGFLLAPFGAALGLPSAMLKVGSGHYTSTITGTLQTTHSRFGLDNPDIGFKNRSG